MAALTVKATLTSFYGEKKPDIEIDQADTLLQVMRKVTKATIDKDKLPKGIPVEEQMLSVKYGNVNITWKYMKDSEGKVSEQVAAQGISQDLREETGIVNSGVEFKIPSLPYRFDNVILMKLCPYDNKPYDIKFLALGKSFAASASSGATLSGKEMKAMEE